MALLLILGCSVQAVMAQNSTFCPGNFFTNGDFEIGVPTNVSNNITLASGWDKIWAGNSEADYYDQFNAAIGAPPSPASGDYGSLWIDSRNLSNSTWREGMLNELATPVPLNTGNYAFSFDIACLHGSGDAEISVYGIYDPNYPGGYVYANSPTASHTPLNVNLFSASGLPQEIVLLGTVPVPNQCDDTYNSMTFSFSTNGLALTGNITHIAIASSDAIIQGGKYVAVDNFCMVVQDNGPDGDYCCDGNNLVQNGNFEAGNTGFLSTYTVGTFPGEYEVTTTAAAFGATVADHSFCSGNFPNNSNFMLVNGRTQQAGSNTIWGQPITGLEEGERYKFCVNFKNMPQCTFDVLPKITLQAGGSTTTATISTTPTDPCDWQSVEMNFTATSTTELIRIILDENGNGDGNDLAIDDIAVLKLASPGLNITVQHQGSNQQITASVNNISVADDSIAGDCEYAWFVAEVNNVSPLGIDIGTLASGNQAGNTVVPPGTSGSPWDLTTTFPDYVFAPNTLYVIGIYQRECGCYASDFAYQLTYNFAESNNGFQLTPEQIAKIVELIEQGHSSAATLSEREEALSIYPNPTNGVLVATLQDEAIQGIQIRSSIGTLIKNISLSGQNTREAIDFNELPAGAYIISVVGVSEKTYTSNFIKQ